MASRFARALTLSTPLHSRHRRTAPCASLLLTGAIALLAPQAARGQVVFEPPRSHPVDDGAQYVEVGDLNGDDILDLLVVPRAVNPFDTSNLR